MFTTLNKLASQDSETAHQAGLKIMGLLNKSSLDDEPINMLWIVDNVDGHEAYACFLLIDGNAKAKFAMEELSSKWLNSFYLGSTNSAEHLKIFGEAKLKALQKICRDPESVSQPTWWKPRNKISRTRGK